MTVIAALRRRARKASPARNARAGLAALLAALAFAPALVGAGELKAVKGALTAGDFVARDLAGRAVKFGELRGKVVLLNFWATWCPPCRKEMPAMERLHQRYKDRGLVVLALSQDQASSREVKAFVDGLELSFPVWQDRDGLVGRQYSIRGVPTSYLIGRDGRITYRALGEYDWDGDEARRAVEALLGG
jgi:peroxiredoxin